MDARYVAMGSSFAAGPGLMPRAEGSPRPSGRSAHNYAHLVAARLGLALTDVTFSGATTSDILRDQIQAVDGSTELVTVTGGGNDVGYLPGLTLASLPRALGVLPVVRRRASEARDASTVDAKFAELESNLAEIVREVHRRAPASRVLMVDYLTILPARPDVSTTGLPADVAAWGREIAARLSFVTGSVADAEGAVLVAASAASAAHHAWSAAPWTRRFHYSLRGGAPYHPNAQGMQAVADLVSAQFRDF